MGLIFLIALVSILVTTLLYFANKNWPEGQGKSWIERAHKFNLKVFLGDPILWIFVLICLVLTVREILWGK